jgi:hypothetical protein
VEKTFSVDFEKELSKLIEKQVTKILEDKLEKVLSVKIDAIIDDIKQQSVETIEIESYIEEDENQKTLSDYIKKINKKFNTANDLIIKINSLSEQLKIRDIDRFLSEYNVNFNKRKFLYYIEQDIIPKANEKVSKNQAFYSSKHILMYLLVSIFEQQLEIDRIKEVIEFFQPLIDELGLDEFVGFAYRIQEAVDKEFIDEYSNSLISDCEYILKSMPHKEKPSKLMIYAANILSSTIMSKKYNEVLTHLMEQYKEN